jgi:UDP-N-acetylglucosamine diphosphorylase / glucose-1-phosphate thymidylyltransferase / UDP-N-acetylgalactosamine diphosphorylase / glucosamine-1-phosphate N-acetyltransferase / galactosamine-1-phosphate N-acetyltransferase
MKALILAAGRGKRLGMHSNEHSKCMLRLFGKPLVQYSLENAVAADVSEIVMVVGYRAEEIINVFGNRFQGTRIRYIIQHEAQGVVHAIECSRPAIGNSSFMLFLADEVLRNPRHSAMIEKFHSEGLFVICGVVDEPDINHIRKTYAVIQDERERRIYRLIEKPRNPPNNIRGTGNCIFQPGIFDFLDLTPINQNRGEKELPDLIQCAIDDGQAVKSFDIGSDYININTPEDIKMAESTYQTTVEWAEDPIEVSGL